MSRKLTAIELNELITFGIDPFKLNLSTNIPIEYVTGFSKFCERYFNVNSHVLIPRIETEQIIDIAKKYINKNLKNLTVNFADIGTGSGCIGITLALFLKEAGFRFNGYISDISEKSLTVAKSNLKKYGLSNQINCLKSNLLKNYSKKLHNTFDIIIANLPYIPTERLKHLNASVRDFEPHMALDGGSNGLDLITALLNESDIFLKSKGIIILEVDDTHLEPIILKGYTCKKEKDINGKNRFWIYEKL